jgi:hypothetical protein
MSIHRRVTMLAATVATIATIGVVTGVAGTGAAPNRGSAPNAPVVAHQVLAPARTYPTGARFVPERVWQQLSDAILIKLRNRQ